VEQYHEKLYRENLELVQKISIFKNWHQEFLHSLVLLLEAKNYNRGQCVLGADDTPDESALYIIKEGEIELSIELPNFQLLNQ
jgi:CRP-like cAMP-binding protein